LVESSSPVKLIVPVVSRTHTDHCASYICRIVQISLQKRISLVGTIIIPKADIQRHRSAQALCLADQIVDPLDQLCSPAKRIFSWESHFHHKKVTFIGCSPVSFSGSPPVSRRDP